MFRTLNPDFGLFEVSDFKSGDRTGLEDSENEYLLKNYSRPEAWILIFRTEFFPTLRPIIRSIVMWINRTGHIELPKPSGVCKNLHSEKVTVWWGWWVYTLVNQALMPDKFAGHVILRLSDFNLPAALHFFLWSKSLLLKADIQDAIVERWLEMLWKITKNYLKKIEDNKRTSEER